MLYLLYQKKGELKMKVNELLKTLKKIRNEYGNIEVMLFDATAWDNGRDNDTIPLYEIDFDEKKKRIILYQKGVNNGI